MESLNRKRIRSVENDGKQRKFFINQKMVDKNDSKIMEKIYGENFMAPKDNS